MNISVSEAASHLAAAQPLLSTPGSVADAASGPWIPQCEAEQLHLPDAVQSFGALLCVHPPTQTIVKASANLENFLGIAAVDAVGRTLESVFSPKIVQQILHFMAQPGTPCCITLSAPSASPSPGAGAVIGTLHAQGALTLIDIEYEEPQGSACSAVESLMRLQASIEAIRQAGSMADLVARVAAELRRATGYDRAMVYRFDRIGHGEVIAEDVSPGLEPFLGIHYPASDVPRQARDLYMRQNVRVLGDTQAAPVPLVSAASWGASPDLSLSAVRAASPIHLEYLRNMGVRATLAVSITLHGTLWGMLICHHGAPRTLPPALRVSCELMGRVTSLMISKRRDEQARAEAALRAEQVRAISISLPDRWGGDGEMADALGAAAKNLLSLCGASGAILRLGGITVSLGRAPEGEAAEKILSALLQAAPDGGAFACESLQTLLPPEVLSLAGGMAAGALVLKLTNRPAEAIAWLRPEHARLVRWGGDPRKPSEGEASGEKISPRRSFEVWKQEVRGRSIPFGDHDLAAATALRDEIERRLAAGVEAMRSARDDAQRAMRAKSDFLATMSHEIRSPLSGLLGVLELLRATRLDADQGRMAAMIHNSATMLLAVLNDILDFSKIEAGAMSTVIDRVRLRQLIDEVVQPHAVTAAKKSVSMTVSVDPALPDYIATDGLRLSQIFNNLLSNAVKFTAAGKVSVRVDFLHAAGEREAGDGEAGKPCLEVCVRDTGIGMSAPVMAQLFAPFMQADGSTTRMFGGTGLGLAISRKLARLLDGDLWVTSQPGVGSEFTLRLPILPCPNLAGIEEAGLEPAEAVALPQSLPHDRRVLVADDDATIRWLSQRQLERLGFSVEVAEDGEAAFSKLLAEPYDLLLTDCHMPRMNGVALTQAVRGAAHERLRALPIIGLTADVTEAQRSICIGAGMTELVTKPLTIERLSRLVLAHLPSPSLVDAPAAPVSLRAMPFEDQIFLSMFSPDDEDGKAWLRGYLANAEADLAEFDALLAVAQGAEPPRVAIAEVAHRMAGSAFSVGAMLLGAEAKALQAAAVDEPLDGLMARRRALGAALAAADAAITVFASP